MNARKPLGKLLGYGMAAVISLALTLQAQTVPGKAQVLSVKGTATYSTAPGGPTIPLKPNMTLTSGATIKTAPASSVDLFLGRSAGVIRVTENSTLSLEKLTLTDTGTDVVVEVLLNLPEGTALFNVNKLSGASKYEVKVPNGVAGIRGTRVRIGSNSYIVLLNGTCIFVFVPPGGNPIPYTIHAPPPMYFSPVDGIRPVSEQLRNDVEQQFTDLVLPSIAAGPAEAESFPEPFVSPGIGVK